VGAGRSEAMLALMGLNPAARRRVHIEGRHIDIRRVGDAIAAGIAYVPEERQRQGAILPFSVRNNIQPGGSGQATQGADAPVSRGMWLSEGR